VIPEHLARDLRYIEIRTARRIRNLRAGTYTSPLRGDGFDFDQHRLYQPRDDVRRIDWNVTARLGVPFLRQTRAERELDVVVVVDLSRSMYFASGQRSKREVAMLTTASLLFSAVADQINTGFLAFNDRVLRWTPPTANSGRAWAALSDLWAIDEAPSPTSLLAAVRHLIRSLKRMTLVVIVSDFLTEENLTASRELGMLAARHDVVAVVLRDKAETRLPAGPGFVRMRDLESGEETTVGLSDAVRERYTHALAERREELIRYCHRTGIDPVFVDTDEEVTERLMAVFERRRC
jgi:uncharacterized protein (DUF58 family)